MKLFISLVLILGLSRQAAGMAVTSLDGIMRQSMEKRVAELKKQPAGAVKYLNQTAFGPDETLENRWRAIVTMGRMDAVLFRASIDRALASRDWYMRNAALIALQTDERPRAVESSSRMLNDPALVVRTQAVRNLVLLNAVETEPLLWRAIADPINFRGHESLWIRSNIAEALARFAVKGRAKGFERLLLDRDERLHKWAVIGLEASTGLRMSDRKEPVEIRRQKWLARLGVQDI